MLNVCQSQKIFIKQSIIHDIRIDGRKNNTRRSVITKQNTIAHLVGSAHLSVQYENLEFYAGIKVKVQQICENINTLPIALQISSMHKLQPQQSKNLNEIHYLIQSHILNILNQCSELSKILTIQNSRKHRLQLYIDVFLLGSPHISQIELILATIRSALLSASIPEIQVTYNEVTDLQTVQLGQKTSKVKDICQQWKWNQLYIIGVVVVKGDKQNSSYFVLDLTSQQYQSMDVCFLVVAQDGKVKYIQTIKGKAQIDLVNKCVKFVCTNLLAK